MKILTRYDQHILYSRYMRYKVIPSWRYSRSRRYIVFPQCPTLAAPLLLLLRGGGYWKGQDPWGEYNVESDRLATGAQLRENKKKSKKRNSKNNWKQPTERTFWTRAFLFTVFWVPPCVLLCVCACFRKNSQIVVFVVVAEVTHHTNRKNIYVCGLQMFCHKK